MRDCRIGDIDVHRLRVAISHVSVGGSKSERDVWRRVRYDDPVDSECGIEANQDYRDDADNRWKLRHSHSC